MTLACSLESLNIVLPPRGIEAVQQEDLRRDIWALEHRNQPIDDWFRNRAKQLNLDVVVSGASTMCYGRSAQKETGILWWTERDSQYQNSAIAAILSLAKSTDAISSPVGLIYCLGRPPKFGLGWSEQKIENIVGPRVAVSNGVWSSNTAEVVPFVELNFEQLEYNIRHIATALTPHIRSYSTSNP